MRKKYINSNKTDVNTIYYRDNKGKILGSSSTYRTTSDKKLSKFSLILGLLSLFVILSSMFLTGYVDSKYENSYVEEVKVIEYQKLVGYEIIDDFSFITSKDDLYKLEGYIIKIIDYDVLKSFPNNFFYNAQLLYGNLTLNLGSFRYGTSRTPDNFYFYNSQFYLSYNVISSTNSKLYLANDYGDLYRYYINYKSDFYDTSNFSSSFTYIYIDKVNSLTQNFNLDKFLFIMNNFYEVYSPIVQYPIYETYFSYEYPTGYYDYDWNGKLEQLSKLRNVFNIGMIDFDKNLYYVNNYKYVRGIKNDGLQSTNYNLLFNDRNIQQLLPYCSVVLYQSWDEKIGSGKRDNYYLWYVYLNELDDNATDTQRKLWNYVKDNYITQYTLENYINYYALKQYEGFYKFTQVLTFPINIINNLMYDFGVLVRFVVDW